MSLPAHEQLGAGRDEGGLAPPDAEHEAGGELLPQHPEHRRRVIRSRSVHLDLAGEHDLLELACRDQLERPPDGLFVVLGRHRTGDVVAAAGSRIEQRQGVRAQLAEAALEAREQLVRQIVGRGERRQGHPHAGLSALRPADEGDLGDAQRCGRERPPVRRAPTVRRECEPADRHRPLGPRILGRVCDRSRGERPPAVCDGREALRPARLQAEHLTEAGEGGPAALGLLEREPALPRAGGTRTRRRRGRPPLPAAGRCSRAPALRCGGPARRRGRAVLRAARDPLRSARSGRDRRPPRCR